MRPTLMTTTVAVLVLVTAGCDDNPGSKQTEPSAVAATASSTPTGHAPAGAKPGSYDDWCGGHQVPESMCTRCNPSLIPAFKASNDWCAEHALPESQCLICNPDLKIERPPRPKG